MILLTRVRVSNPLLDDPFFRHFFRRPRFTVEYPDQRWPLPAGYRGAPVLVTGEFVLGKSPTDPRFGLPIRTIEGRPAAGAERNVRVDESGRSVGLECKPQPSCKKRQGLHAPADVAQVHAGNLGFLRPPVPGCTLDAGDRDARR